jgi:mono/diheme cytochrome c family protein
MFGEVSFIISLASIFLSVAALFRSAKAGVPGPQGPAGPQGASGPQAPAAAPIAPAATSGAVVCSSCHRVVARFTRVMDKPVCANCKPLPK